MKKCGRFIFGILVCVLTAGCFGSGDGGHAPVPPNVVNTFRDIEDPPAGTVTLRSALAHVADGEPVFFDRRLDGGIIELSIVADAHTVLKGEVMGMREEPSGPVSYLVGYFERDYGKSALYARKNVVIDASDLPSGITISWKGGEADPARVLAVYGDLTLINVAVTGGRSVAEDISADNPEQPWTLARGAGVAVWGAARLEGCRLYDNRCVGDFESSRDRGAFGGGLYADIVDMNGCIVSGNSVLGGGAAGGGVFSVGGAEVDESASVITGSAITGNAIRALFTYGGGVYSDGGGIGKRKTLELRNCTIARNLAEPPPDMPPFLMAMGYWRGGGVYMSNGYLFMQGCTVVENQVRGVARTDALGKPNLAGGVAATIGNAHAVEDMTIGQSVVTGNVVEEIGGHTYDHDIFTGSLLYFNSLGYNRIGVIDFSQILVPVGEKNWKSLCRRHYPKAGDGHGVDISDVLDIQGGTMHSGTIISAGTDAGNPAVLHYQPRGQALDQVPESAYVIQNTYAEYALDDGGTDNFTSVVLGRIEDHFGIDGFAVNFQTAFEDFLQSVDIDEEADGNQPYVDPDGAPILVLADALWFGPAVTWPKELCNYPYIAFWHRLDTALQDAAIPGMGPELLGDDVWQTLFPSSGPLDENPDITLTLLKDPVFVYAPTADQYGIERPVNGLGDIGAVEMQ